MRPPLPAPSLLSLGLLLTACRSAPDTKATTTEPPAALELPTCMTEGPARSPLRRLTPAELDRTLTDLLGPTTASAQATLPPEQVGGFSNNVDVRPAGVDTVDAASRFAQAVSAEAAADPAVLLDCPGLFEDVELEAQAEDGDFEDAVDHGDHVGLYVPGTVAWEVDLPAAGTYAVEVLVRGSECGGAGADWNLFVDGVALAEGASAEDWTWEGARLGLDAGAHTVEVSFIDDCWLPEADEDANLFVDALRLRADSVAVGDPDEMAACVEDWLETLLPRAWRHPLEDPAEAERLVVLFERASAEWGVEAGLRTVLEVVLQSPRFLYRVEESALAASPGEVVFLDGHELAVRLSYFLWGTMPDAELFAAAASGTLSTTAGLEAQALRMLADPRAQELIELFFMEWLELDRLDHIEKDLTVYPDWTDARPASFREETLRFVRAVWTEEQASFTTLLTADWTVADAELAAFYGLTPTDTGWARVARDPSAHAGLLTQGAFLASRARAHASSPIYRGMFVRGALLCHTIPGPDPSLTIAPPDPDPEATTRELIEQHRADPACASCHDLIDPPGLAFEHFDGSGRYRTHDNGLPVDASAVLSGTDVDGTIEGAAELGQAMASSAMVRECFARQWFRFAHGRAEAAGDACSVDEAAGQFEAEGLDMEALVLATVLSPAFRTAVGSP